MKKFILILYLYSFLILPSCTNTKVVTDDIACLREVNTVVSKHIQKELGQEYDSIKTSIKLIMRFYVKENGKADSIAFERSNLEKIGINESYLIKILKRKKFKCLRKVYYSGQHKPDNVVIIYNPRLTVGSE